MNAIEQLHKAEADLREALGKALEARRAYRAGELTIQLGEATKAPPAAAVNVDLARDAARYRWLRNDSGNAFDDPVIQGKYIGSPKADWLTGEHADEAIDRAMLAAPKGDKP